LYNDGDDNFDDLLHEHRTSLDVFAAAADNDDYNLLHENKHKE
jgi:hypothetical protein